jgi:hypothetical protein
MNAKTNGTLNTTLLRDYVCAQCHGRLVEHFTEGRYVVHCPRACQPGGFVTQHFADQQRANDISQYMEAARNYPHLAPHTPPEKLAQAEADLFG